MKQAEDRSTLELPELVASGFLPKNEAPKRGRGRPRKNNALSAADRARRYRQRQALKRTMAAKLQGLNNGQAGRLRDAQPRGSLAYSVLCELTMGGAARYRFVPVTQL